MTRTSSWGDGVTIASLRSEFAGSWVALKGGDARPTPGELVMVLNERQIRDAIILRVPAKNEAQLVGLG